MTLKKTKQTVTRLSAKMYSELLAIAKQKGIKPGKIIRGLLRPYLKKVKYAD